MTDTDRAMTLLIATIRRSRLAMIARETLPPLTYATCTMAEFQNIMLAFQRYEETLQTEKAA